MFTLATTGGYSLVNLLRQFRDLPAVEQKLLLETLALVAATRLLLWTVPFLFARRLVSRRTAVSPALAQIPVKRLSWSVQVEQVGINNAMLGWELIDWPSTGGRGDSFA